MSQLNEFFDGLELNDSRFVELLRKLIGETRYLQNNPPALLPEEDRAGQHVLDVLRPFSTENGGPLIIKQVHYAEKRGNIIVKYPAAVATEKTFSIVGSHLDVVPADEKRWEVPPFELTVQGDKLYGRGTTDCLGHVALLTELFVELATKKPELAYNFITVFIVSEESSGGGDVGAEKLYAEGHFEELKHGPVLWLDCADMQPCMGSGGCLVWKLDVTGKLFHTGLSHRGINAIELGMDAIGWLQKKFYAEYPPHEMEKVYKFSTPSTFKPTQISCNDGSLNQLPHSCTVQGDIRLVPFYSVHDVQKKLSEWTEELNQDLAVLNPRGPLSRYILAPENGGEKGSVKLVWLEDEPCEGVACDLEGSGFKILCKATEDILGEVKPYSIGGSLPIVGDLRRRGFDIQLVGYGVSEVYHYDNEYCRLSDMKKGYQILARSMKLFQQECTKGQN
eukprot:GILI01005341.1.p1 GENE.GILI01005341.1~~GILI01005341.1.p1  ORF type:complete len:449 (-),score=131.16 GILI01005341.1:440-1786(-)